MDYLPFPGYTDPDELEVPNSPVEVQSRALKEAIDYTDINCKFLLGKRNLLYGEALLTNKVRNILDIDSAPNEEKEGSFLVKSLPEQLTTTVTWVYQPEYHPNVLRLWVTSIEQTSSQVAKQDLRVVEPLVTNQQDKEPNQQFHQPTNQVIGNKNSILKETFKLINSDEFANACLTCATIIFMFLAIGFPLLDFRNKLEQGQRNSLTSVLVDTADG